MVNDWNQSLLQARPVDVQYRPIGQNHAAPVHRWRFPITVARKLPAILAYLLGVGIIFMATLYSFDAFGLQLCHKVEGDWVCTENPAAYLSIILSIAQNCVMILCVWLSQERVSCIFDLVVRSPIDFAGIMAQFYYFALGVFGWMDYPQFDFRSVGDTVLQFTMVAALGFARAFAFDSEKSEMGWKLPLLTFGLSTWLAKFYFSPFVCQGSFAWFAQLDEIVLVLMLVIVRPCTGLFLNDLCLEQLQVLLSQCCGAPENHPTDRSRTLPIGKFVSYRQAAVVVFSLLATEMVCRDSTPTWGMPQLVCGIMVLIVTVIAVCFSKKIAPSKKATLHNAFKLLKLYAACMGMYYSSSHYYNDMGVSVEDFAELAFIVIFSLIGPLGLRLNNTGRPLVFFTASSLLVIALLEEADHVRDIVKEICSARPSRFVGLAQLSFVLLPFVVDVYVMIALECLAAQREVDDAEEAQQALAAEDVAEVHVDLAKLDVAEDKEGTELETSEEEFVELEEVAELEFDSESQVSID